MSKDFTVSMENENVPRLFSGNLALVGVFTNVNNFIPKSYKHGLFNTYFDVLKFVPLIKNL